VESTFFLGAERDCPPEPITAGPATAHTPTNFQSVEIRYKTFIWCDAIEVDPPSPVGYPYHMGDKRYFGYDLETSRSYQSYVVSVDPVYSNASRTKLDEHAAIVDDPFEEQDHEHGQEKVGPRRAVHFDRAGLSLDLVGTKRHGFSRGHLAFHGIEQVHGE